MTAPRTEHWIAANGLELLVEDLGSGPPVLLAHGMWCDAGMFAALAEDLAKDHRVIVPDLRGHGRSEIPTRQWQIGDLAVDLRAILDSLKLGKVILAGFSMGGMAAVDFALRYPDRLTGLVLMGTSAAAEDWLRVAEIRALARLIEVTGKPRVLAREAARSTFSPGYRKFHRAEVARWEHAVQSMSREALVHALRAVGGREALLERLDEIKIPTLILTGSGDRILSPRWSRAMARRLPRGRLVSWPRTGHAIPMERPGEVAAWIRGLESGSYPGDR